MDWFVFWKVNLDLIPTNSEVLGMSGWN